MTEAELATKAPESDAMETNEPLMPEEETKPQTSSGMGEHCTTDRPTPDGHQPSGELTQFDDIEVYISKPADYPNNPAKLLLLLTGGTGIKSKNNQLQADAFAREGFLVVMPDQFTGDTVPGPGTLEDDAVSPSIIDQIKMGFASTAKSFLIDMWLARHTPEKVLPIIHKALETAKEEYADAVANGGGVYAAGYCFGAKYVIILAGTYQDQLQQSTSESDASKAPAPKDPLIKVGAIAHATSVTREDFRGVQSPLSMVCVEHDPLFPDEILDFAKKTFASLNVEHEVSVYPEVPHGFAVVGDYKSDIIKKAQSTAFDQMLNWLRRH